MNRDFIRTNVGKRVQLRAIAIHLGDNDVEMSEADDDWTILAYDDRVLTIENTRTGSVGPLHDDAVYSFTHNTPRGPGFGILRLTVQVYVRGREVSYEPVTRPGERLSVKPHSLLSEALLEASLACHFWKNMFMNMHSIYGSELPGAERGEFADVWDLMEARWIPEYTPELYERYKPLFKTGLEHVQSKIDRLHTLFGDVLPSDYRAELVRATRQLDVESSSYALMRHLGHGLGQPPKDEAQWFRVRFTSVIRVLRHCAREADRRRDLLKRPG